MNPTSDINPPIPDSHHATIRPQNPIRKETIVAIPKISGGLGADLLPSRKKLINPNRQTTNHIAPTTRAAKRIVLMGVFFRETFLISVMTHRIKVTNKLVQNNGLQVNNDKYHKSVTTLRMSMLYLSQILIETIQIMKTNEKKSFLATTPSAVLALLTFFGALILLFGIGEGIGGEIGGALAYILSDLVIAVCCFFIVKQNPGSIWYVPIICNLMGIIAAIVEPNFWISSMWIYVSIGWVLSIVASIIGALKGKKIAISENL